MLFYSPSSSSSPSPSKICRFNPYFAGSSSNRVAEMGSMMGWLVKRCLGWRGMGMKMERGSFF